MNATTGWYDMAFREYDPATGRMLQVDPMTVKYASLTPYNYAFDNPVMWSDPSGADPLDEFLLDLFINSQGERKYNGAEVAKMFADYETGGAGGVDWNSYGTDMASSGCSYCGGELGDYASGAAVENEYGLWVKTAKGWVDVSTTEQRIRRFIFETQELFGSDAQQGDPFGFGREDLNNSYYTVRSDYTRMKHLLGEFLSGEGPERSLFYGSHPLTKGMMNSAVAKRAKEYYAANYKNGGDMRWQHIDFFVTDVPFVGSDIEQFVGSARVSIYPRDGMTIFVIDNTTGIFSGSYDKGSDIPRIPGEITPRGNIYQRFIWIEGN